MAIGGSGRERVNARGSRAHEAFGVACAREASAGELAVPTIPKPTVRVRDRPAE